MHQMRTLLLLALAATTGCAPAEQPPPGEPAGPEQTARRLVAELLDVDPARIEVVSVEAREFSDSSLDCPQPGMSYLQVITPGYRVLLEADGRRFDVRTSGGQGRICRQRKPGDTDAEPRGNGAAVSGIAEAARNQLAAQLDTSASAIEMLGIRNRRPGEALPGCNSDCQDERDCGYVIQLRYEQRRYTYVAEGDKLAPCPAIAAS